MVESAGENGLMLIGYNHGEYEFEDVSPRSISTKLTFRGFLGQRKDYFDFLEESGIVCRRVRRKVYLRKNRSHDRWSCIREC